MVLQSTILTLLLGRTVPVPATPQVIDALDSVQVSMSDSGRSGFQLTFAAGRSGAADLGDHPLLRQSQLALFSRVVLTVAFGGAPQVLMDGFITHRELTPGAPGNGTFTVTGEDVTVMMDLEQRVAEHPAQDEATIATALIVRYAKYGLVPRVTRPRSSAAPSPADWVPVQRGTDLQHLRKLAATFGFVFYVVPGPATLTNQAFWGPPVRTGTPQPALSVGLGAETNVQRISFRSDGMAPVRVVGRLQDRGTDRAVDVRSGDSERTPLSAEPDWKANLPDVRTVLFNGSGLTTAEATARAQGIAEAGTDSVAATGTLDALSYGHLLTARGLVGLRGAGRSHDGLYYVKRVGHRISRGGYTQDFTLTRDGLGSTVSSVRP